MKPINYFKDITLKSPVLFGFNLKRHVFQQFGLDHYQTIEKILKEENENSHLFPIINPWRTSIETRAKYISLRLPEVFSFKI